MRHSVTDSAIFIWVREWHDRRAVPARPTDPGGQGDGLSPCGNFRPFGNPGPAGRGGRRRQARVAAAASPQGPAADRPGRDPDFRPQATK
jgi:hypothetical protein